ncbi:30S ribosomal protein S11 [Patescibacteria group bacterium]|nr:30S ribosomal protein S11 [Patescibacteria group bacterium]MBU2508860.1 30S ribosomal protein S11 [Patescibacteria group bacterium]
MKQQEITETQVDEQPEKVVDSSSAEKGGESETGGKSKSAKARSKKKSKVKKQVSHGKVYIQATYNNTIISITDLNGNVLAWGSAGSVGFKGPKKATPYAATVVVKKISEKVEPYGLREANMFISGVGSGREGAIRAFNAQGINILTIKDVTPIPHNGCRPPRPRRV